MNKVSPIIHTPAGNVYAPGIKSRFENQRTRIENGVDSGALTDAELDQLKGEEQGVYQDLTFAKADNGSVGLGERKLIHQELNQVSRDIYDLKHNDDPTPTA